MIIKFIKIGFYNNFNTNSKCFNLNETIRIKNSSNFFEKPIFTQWENIVRK